MATKLRGAPWWVVFVRFENDPFGCVYGGRAGTVIDCVDRHAAWAGPVAHLETFPFDSVIASLAGRVEIEKRFAA